MSHRQNIEAPFIQYSPPQSSPLLENSELLLPLAYSPNPSPSALNDNQFTSYDSRSDVSTPPQPVRLPPPPPPKLPTDDRHENHENHEEELPEYRAFEGADSQTPHLWRQDDYQQPPPVHDQEHGQEPSSTISLGLADVKSPEGPNSSFEPPAVEPAPQYHLRDTGGDVRPPSHTLHSNRTQYIQPDGGYQPHPSSMTQGFDPPSHEDEHVSSTVADQRFRPSLPARTAIQPDESEPRGDHHRNDSFYWHSPHSSSSSLDQQGRTISAVASPLSNGHATASEQKRQEKSKLLGHNAQLSHSSLGFTNASALGFGGPSDWEHFGDYDAEDVDDTELYTRPKAELPTEKSPTEDVQQQRHPPSDNETPHLEQSLMAGGVTDHSTTAEPRPQSQHLTDSVHANNGDFIVPGRAERNDSEVNSYETPTKPPNVQHGEEPTPNAEDSMEAASHKEMASPNDVQSSLHRTPPVEDIANIIVHTASQASAELSLRSKPQLDQQHIPSNYPAQHEEPTLTGGSQDNIDNYAAQSELLTNVIADQSRNEETRPPTEPATNEGDENSQSGSSQIYDKYANESDLSEPSSSTTQDIAPTVQRRLPTLKTRTSALQEGREGESSTPISASIKTASVQPHQRNNSVGSITSLNRASELENLFIDLDPWGRASLNRYLAMLREEAKAESDREKLTIFTVFAKRESRLRAVLYGAESEDEPDSKDVTPKKTFAKAVPLSRTNTSSLKRSSTSKALPALPKDDKTEPLNSDASPKIQPAVSPIVEANPNYPSLLLNINSNEETNGKDEAKAQDDVEYSPGGRPRMTQTKMIERTSRPDLQVILPSEKYFSELKRMEQNGENRSPGSDAPIAVPAYTPFKFNEKQSEGDSYPGKRQSVYRPYATARLSSFNPDSSSFDASKIDEKDMSALPGLPAQAGRVAPADKDSQKQHTPPLAKAKEVKPLELRRFEAADFDPLVSVLPQEGATIQESAELVNIKHEIDAIPDDFSFIHQSVLAWDANAKMARENNEKERHARQVESEQRIDELFDDNEIGYGDISELEADFKRSEAARKAEEDRSEYQTFVSEVFDLVWTRLHFELDQLSPKYDQCTDLADETLVGRDMFEGLNGQPALAPTTSLLLILHQKLEVRHQKAFEAVLERDRRLKKTEVSPWYTLGNVVKVKQLERQFEAAERNAIVEYCRQRDIRANKLMDVLDQNTLRGVGANQDYMEAIMKSVRRIASGRAYASVPGSDGPGLEVEQVRRAETITAALSTSSEQIVQTYHVADMLLNAADYEVSVAQAKMANADSSKLKELKEERAKEDQKLMRDLEHRLALIREDSRKTNDEIVKLLCFLGVQGGHGMDAPPAARICDAEHQERLQKALEDAKRRNAAKEGAIE